MSRQYPIDEHKHSINGVSGRMFAIQEPQEVRGNMVHQAQKWVSERRGITGYGPGGTIYVTIRFDDECKNGHQSFSITADVYTAESRRQRDIAAGGCLHEDIAQVFPELVPLIKWHLTSTDGPMHYVANTVYHASNRDCHGYQAGEPCSWGSVIFFGNSPVSHDISAKFAAFLESRRGTGDFNIEEHGHTDSNGRVYDPHFTFAGYTDSWAVCPFKNRATAEQWQAACNAGIFRIDKIVTGYSAGKERNLDAAREAAVWSEATDGQLCLPAAELTALLEARLPGLIAEFRAAMDAAGLLWEP